MKAVVLGANGQLGTEVVRFCPSEFKLISLTRKDLDVTDKQKIFSVVEGLRPDVVINASAYTKVDDAEDNEDICFAVNAIAVKNIAMAVESIGAVMVHISTDYVFDGSNLALKRPYYEKDIPNPVNVYGLAKYAGELACLNYCQKAYVIRVASLFGKAGAMGKGGNFVYTMIRVGREKGILNVVDDIYMSPTYAVDAARQIWDIILSNRAFGLYHAVNAGVCSWYEFASEIISQANVKAVVTPVKHTQFPTKARRPLWSPLGSEKGVSLRPWQDALRDFLSSI